MAYVHYTYAYVLLELSKKTYGLNNNKLCPGHNCIPKVLFWLRKAVTNGYHDPQAINLIEKIKSDRDKSCAVCDVKKATVSACVRCKAIWYCGKECQVKDWKNGHKHDCIKCDVL